MQITVTPERKIEIIDQTAIVVRAINRREKEHAQQGRMKQSGQLRRLRMGVANMAADLVQNMPTEVNATIQEEA